MYNKDRKTKLSYIIPCYNSEQTINVVVEEIIAVMAKREEYEYEIILVNDASTDKVLETMKILSKKYNQVRWYSFTKNFGQHSALMAGYRHASGDIIISLDDDGQTPPSEVFVLVDKLNEGYDVIFARYPQKKQNLFRKLGSAINEMMAEKIIGKPKHLSVTSFFVMNRIVLNEIIKYKGSYPYILGLILRTTRNIANVEVAHKERISGKSGYNIKKLLSLWINGFTAFSVKPLRFATVVGFITAILGFLSGLYVVIHKLLNPATPMGYSSIMAVLLFIGGLVMIILGMIGEYVGRIYINCNNAPQYVIADSIEKANMDVYEKNE